MSKPLGTEDTVAGTEDTVAPPSQAQQTQPRVHNDSGVRTPTVGDSLRGANIENFDPVERKRYEVLGELARGGLGRVMRARDPRTGRIVALKEIITPSPDTITRFAREALVTANLQHPSIVPVYEVGRWPNGEPFYAMKLVQGRTLTEIVAKAKTAAERLALLPHAIAVADALAYAHSEHVIHRDLKPGNILVGSYGETVVIDWGLARNLATGEEVGALSNPSIDLGTETIVGTVIGTPAFMPPEQAHGAPIDEGADVYAIGALIYHMLSGARPYADARTPDEVVERVKAGPPYPLAKLVPDAPPELIAIVEKAMARPLAERYRSAERLAEDLRRFQTGKLVGAHRYTTWQLVRRWVAKHSAILGTGAAALIVLIIVGVLSVRRIAVERDEARQQRGLAQSAEKLAVERYSSSLEELARQAAIAGAPERAMPLLAGAGADHHTPASGILAGQAAAAFRGIVGLAPAQLKYTLSAVLTRDGKRLVTASGQAKVIAWDVETGAQPWAAEGVLLALAPDDKTLLVANANIITLRAMADGKQLATWTVASEITALVWNESGERFAVGTGTGEIAIGTPAGPLVAGDKHGKRVRAIAWRGDAIASAGDDGAVLVRGKRLAENPTQLWAVAWIDATHVVAGGEDHIARIWNIETGAVEKKLDHGIDIYGIVVGPTWLATWGGDARFKIWPLAGGPPRDLVGHRLAVNNAIVVGDWLIASDETGQVIAWDPKSGEPLRALPYEGVIEGLVARGDLLLVYGELRTRIWRFDPQAIVHRLAGHTARTRDLALTADTAWTTSNDGTVRSFALDGKRKLVLGTADLVEPTITGPDDPNMMKPPNPHGARGVTVLPDRKRVATTYEDGRIVIWDAETGAQLASWKGHTGRVRAIAFDGAFGYSVGDTTVRKWDVATGAEVARADLGGPGFGVGIHGDVVVTQTDNHVLAVWSTATLAPGAKVEFAKQHFRDTQFAGDLLLAGDDNNVVLIDIHTGKTVRTASQSEPFAADLGVDAIVVGDAHGEVVLYDRQLVRIRSWRTGDNLTSAVRFRPDGKIVATGSAHNIRIWDPASGALLAERRDFETMITRLEWTPDGTRLAMGGGATYMWLWDLTPAAPSSSCITPWQLVDSTLVETHDAKWCSR